MNTTRFSGWTVIGAAGLLYMLLANFALTASQLIIPSLAADPAVTMDRTMIGVGFTVFVLLQGLAGPVVGQIITKLGTRITYALGSILIIAAGILLSMFAGTSTLAYIVLFGVLLSFSTAVGGQITMQTTVGNWFIKKRGLAMGITIGVGSALSFFIPLITNFALGADGNWHMGFLAISVVAAVGLVVSLVFIRDSPEKVGQLPDGGQQDDETTKKREYVSTVYKTKHDKTLKQALRNFSFWAILITGFSLYFALNADIAAGVFCFSEAGASQDMIALALGIQSIVMVIVSVGAGFIADRIEPARILGVSALVTAIGASMAIFCKDGNNLMLYTYFVLMGVGFGCNNTLMATAIANFFGMEHYPRIIGIALPVIAVLSGTAPIIGGVIYDSVGSYDMFYIIVCVFLVIGFLGSIFMRYPKDDVE